ncbi:MAG TPA: hypothetical protein DIW17_11300, partial [Clostridiales bacterium]|nr:hypothetical protein [Clostridiales bacterium]
PISAANSFVKLTVKEAYFLDLFKGIEAPGGQQYLALDLDFAFEKSDPARAEKEYLIPTIFQHFYVSLNNGRMMPASNATWLAEKPFTEPGCAEINLKENETKGGILIFLVDYNSDEEIEQLSLHMYDVGNGHIDLPITGSIPQTFMDISSLPAGTPENISDAFLLSLTGI